jgi:hypothetical protein
MVLVESLASGLVTGFCVGYFLLRFFEKIPTKNPILKSMILSFAILLIIEAFTFLLNLGNLSVYLLIGAGINVPRFLALGLVIGYLFKRMFSGFNPSVIVSKSPHVESPHVE